MKGIIFNLVEDVVTTDHGPDAWDDLLDDAGVVGAYSAMASYPDEDLSAVLDAAALMTGMSRTRLEEYVGHRAISPLALRYPEFFDSHTTCATFLRSLNDVIHAEVRKVYPGADPPSFVVHDPTTGPLSMEYHSARDLCGLAVGLITGSAERFGEDVIVTQPQCTRNAAPFCLLQVTWR